LAGKTKVDREAIKVLADLLREMDLAEIEYQVDSLKIKVSRSIQQIPIPLSSNPQIPIVNQNSSDESIKKIDSSPEDLANHAGVIEAQMVGTVYLSPGPGTKPFVSVGEKVSQGQTLFIIEAMKVMNMIKAPRFGIIKHIFVKDSQPVEYGDPIVIID
jgi:acetyl-CoA carboxylase biotin carboxyl carrier protein